MPKPKVFARVVGFVDVDSDTLKPFTIGDYTLHKEYEVEGEGAEEVEGHVFYIRDDRGDLIWCKWYLDPDCLFERLESL